MRMMLAIWAAAVLAGCSPVGPGASQGQGDQQQQPAATAEKKYEKIPSDHLAAESLIKGMTRKSVLDRFGEPQQYRDVAGYGWASPALAYEGQFQYNGKIKNTVCLYFKLNALGEPVVVDLQYY